MRRVRSSHIFVRVLWVHCVSWIFTAEEDMPVVKSIELTGESTKSWEEAVKVCVAEAARTLKNIRKIEVISQEGIVEGNHLQLYTVTCKLSFVIDDSLR